jgi:Bacterial transcriptional activator domain
LTRRPDSSASSWYESWAVTEARRLTELHTGAIESVGELLADAGDWSGAIATVQPLIETEPFRDRPRAILMRALAYSGRRTDALRDSSTLVALMHLLASLHGWTDDTWAAERDAAIGRYLSPDHEAAVERCFTTLGEEVDRWERRLSRPRRRA